MMIIAQLGWQEDRTATQSWQYRVADHELISDYGLIELAAFDTGKRKTSHWPLMAPPVENSSAKITYDGPGWIGNRWREILCKHDKTGYRLEAAGAGQFWVAPDGRGIVQEQPDPGAQKSIVTETFLGPALILALALQGTWCLHASAVAFGDRVIAFVGESGRGKSTLAAFLDTVSAVAWQRVADDILPVSPHATGLDALPHYPQLKLPIDQQSVEGLPQHMPLAAVYLLAEPSNTERDVEIQALTVREAALTLVRHTVAARLLDHDLLEQQLDFAAGIAAHTPVRRLIYPHQRGVLERMGEIIAVDLQANAAKL